MAAAATASAGTKGVVRRVIGGRTSEYSEVEVAKQIRDAGMFDELVMVPLLFLKMLRTKIVVNFI